MTLTWGLVVLIQGTTFFDTGYRFSDFEGCQKAKATARLEVINRKYVPSLEEEVVENGLVCIPMKKKG